MTLEQYISKVFHGEITPIIRPPDAPLPINQGIDPGNMESVQRNRCLARHNGWVCTLSKGHDGRHVARQPDGRYCDDWE